MSEYKCKICGCIHKTEIGMRKHIKINHKEELEKSSLKKFKITIDSNTHKDSTEYLGKKKISIVAKQKVPINYYHKGIRHIFYGTIVFLLGFLIITGSILITEEKYYFVSLWPFLVGIIEFFKGIRDLIRSSNQKTEEKALFKNIKINKSLYVT